MLAGRARERRLARPTTPNRRNLLAALQAEAQYFRDGPSQFWRERPGGRARATARRRSDSPARRLSARFQASCRVADRRSGLGPMADASQSGALAAEPAPAAAAASADASRLQLRAGDLVDTHMGLALVEQVGEQSEMVSQGERGSGSHGCAAPGTVPRKRPRAGLRVGARRQWQGVGMVRAYSSRECSAQALRTHARLSVLPFHSLLLPGRFPLWLDRRS